ncbi:MAG TPA: hypothetical protein VIR64_09065 [Pseudobacillus sp.]
MKMLIAILIVAFALNFIRNRKWKLLRTVHGHESYYAVVGKLRNHGVPYKIRTPITFGGRSFHDNTQYDIYVKEEDEHMAVAALREHQ